MTAGGYNVKSFGVMEVVSNLKIYDMFIWVLQVFSCKALRRFVLSMYAGVPRLDFFLCTRFSFHFRKVSTSIMVLQAGSAAAMNETECKGYRHKQECRY